MSTRVLLTYRADIVEAAGIDVSELDTWDKFMAAMAPLVKDLNGDGRPDQYILEMPETNAGIIVPIIMQAGGDLFDTNDAITIDTDLNAKVLSKFAIWAAAGPGKLSADKATGDGPGRKLQMDGYVLAWVTPDWRAGPERPLLEVLSGKLKLMPLPAWEEGGRRTTVMGGTMVAIPASNPDITDALRVAVKLYSDQDIARQMFEITGIISPVKALWSSSFYDEPEPYYSEPADGAPLRRAGPACAGPRPHHPSSNWPRTKWVSPIGRLIKYAGHRENHDENDLYPKARAPAGDGPRRT